MAGRENTAGLSALLGKRLPAWRVKRIGRNILLYALAYGLTLLFAVPFLWAVSSSLKPVNELFLWPPRLLPQTWQWYNYVEIWEFAPLARFFINTVFVTVFTVIGRVGSAAVVGYGFARFRFPYRNLLFILVLSTLMLPYQVTIIPTFLLFKALGWLDTYNPLIIPHWLGGGAFAIFLFRQFFMTIPKDLDEAAKIDGANTLWIFLRIIVPLSKPVIITMVLIAFLDTWNDFFGPLIYLNSPEKYTLSLAWRTSNGWRPPAEERLNIC